MRSIFLKVLFFKIGAGCIGVVSFQKEPSEYDILCHRFLMQSKPMSPQSEPSAACSSPNPSNPKPAPSPNLAASPASKSTTTNYAAAKATTGPCSVETKFQLLYSLGSRFLIEELLELKECLSNAVRTRTNFCKGIVKSAIFQFE